MPSLAPLLLAGAAAFAPAATPARAATLLNAEMSAAIPFLKKPKGLDGWVGDVGFDPLGLAELFGDMKWLREAEIKHGRVAMLACLGYVFGEACAGVCIPGDDYSVHNPIVAAQTVPPEAFGQIVLFSGLTEWKTNNGKLTALNMFEDGRDPG